jgi:hypothetical protein
MMYLSAIRIAEPWTFASLFIGVVLLVAAVVGIAWFIRHS